MTDEVCLGCKTSPCAYPLQWMDFRRLTYRWFAKEYYDLPWARKILTRYRELEEILFQFPDMPPPKQWLSKHNAFMAVFNGMRGEGMVNYLAVKPVVFPRIKAPGDVELWNRYPLDFPFPDHVVVVGNQRLAVLRMFWEFGWLKSPLVGVRVAKSNDPNTDRVPVIFAHPYKVRKGNRWVQP